MSIKSQKENVLEPWQWQSTQKQRHIVARVLVYAFITLNALVILLALLPAIIHMPFLRHIAIPTPWHFHAGYGTPLGLSFVSALIISALSAILIALSVAFLRRIIRGGIEFCGILAVVACIVVMVNISENPDDYVRESLLRDFPENVRVVTQIHESHRGPWGWVERETSLSISISVGVETISINEFEDFVIDVQPQLLNALQRRRVEVFSFNIFLDSDDTQVLHWHSSSSSPYVGYYGNLSIRTPHIGFQYLRDVPIADIREITDTVVAIDYLAGEIAEKYGIDRDLNRLAWPYYDEERRSYNPRIEVGKVGIDISLFPRDFPFYAYETETTLIEIDEFVRAAAQRHNLEVYWFVVFFTPIDFSERISWMSHGASGEYGELRFGRSGGVQFDDVHITEIQELFTEELIEMLHAEDD